jgi:hypothetical protein
VYRAGGYTPDDLRKFVPVVDQVQGQQLGGLADYLRAQRRPNHEACPVLPRPQPMKPPPLTWMNCPVT